MPVSVSWPLPAGRFAIPIHQLVEITSLPPRGPPWWLTVANSTPSDISIHGEEMSCARHARGESEHKLQ